MLELDTPPPGPCDDSDVDSSGGKPAARNQRQQGSDPPPARNRAMTDGIGEEMGIGLGLAYTPPSAPRNDPKLTPDLLQISDDKN